VSPTLRSFGAITACAPAPSATRRHAPEVVRVLHAVEDEESGRLVDSLEHVLDELRHLHVVGLGDHALVLGTARHAVEALGSTG
jgi:hypothetical protein